MSLGVSDGYSQRWEEIRPAGVSVESRHTVNKREKRVKGFLQLEKPPRLASTRGGVPWRNKALFQKTDSLPRRQERHRH
jgi:hypothetical protein